MCGSGSVVVTKCVVEVQDSEEDDIGQGVWGLLFGTVIQVLTSKFCSTRILCIDLEDKGSRDWKRRGCSVHVLMFLELV